MADAPPEGSSGFVPSAGAAATCPGPKGDSAYRELFEATPAPALIFDPQTGKIVHVNAAAVSFYGYPRDRLERMGIFELCVRGETAQDEYGDRLDALPHLFSTHRLADGTVRDVEIFSKPLQLRGQSLVYSLIIDVTEQKRVQAELQANRKTLEHAQAVGRIGSWVSDASPEGRLLWSSQVFRIFGVAPETFDQQISTFFRHVHPDDVEAVRQSVAAAIRDHSVYRVDHRIIRPDGEVRWVLEQGEVEYDENGTPLRVIGVVQDITERKHAEQALRDSEEHLRTTLQVLAEGCVVLSTRGLCVECNAAAENILGMPRERIIGSMMMDRRGDVTLEDGSPCPPDQYPAAVCLATGQPVNSSIVGFRRADGERRWLSVNARPLRSASGETLGVVASFSDITDRRAAEQALRETAHRYELLFDANPEPLWVYDLETLRFLAVNRAAVETYGYTRDEFRAMTIMDIRAPDHRERLRRHLDTLDPSRRMRGTWTHRLKDGREIDVEVISHPIEFQGRPARIVLAKDITERLRAERALRDSEACLIDAQRIGEFGDWEFDPASGRSTWSEQLYRIFRRDPALGPLSLEEMIACYDPEDRDRLQQALRDALEHDRSSDLDLHLLLPSGQDVWHRSVISAALGTEGKVRRLRGVVQDITARKQAELALRRTQLRLATILEHLPDVVIYEADHLHLHPSENIVRLVGYPASMFHDDRAAFVRLIHPADASEAADRIERLLTSRHTDSLVLQYRLRHRDGHYIWVEDRMVFEHPAQGSDRLLGFLIDISQRKSFEQRQRLMMAELDHRVKNNIATVIALLEQTGRTTKTQADLQQTLLGRLLALARMHKALSRTHWEGVGLRSLVAQTLEAYQSDPPGRVAIVGEDYTLPARAASPVAMAIHELATNAVKYGSLSSPRGSVRVEWTMEEDASGGRTILLEWTESGGPPVTPPTAPGFGTELIQGGIAYELHGEAQIHFLPGGVRCVMKIPLGAVAENPLSPPGFP